MSRRGRLSQPWNSLVRAPSCVLTCNRPSKDLKTLHRKGLGECFPSAELQEVTPPFPEQIPTAPSALTDHRNSPSVTQTRDGRGDSEVNIHTLKQSLSTRVILSLRGHWAVLVVTPEWGCYWHLVGRCQGCCLNVLECIRQYPITKTIKFKLQIVPRLRNPALNQPVIHLFTQRALLGKFPRAKRPIKEADNSRIISRVY